MKCEKCKKNESNLSAIVNGVYFAEICYSCKSTLDKRQSPSSGHAKWARSIDLEDHEADIQQPYNADGTPNALFAKLYPEQARAVFSEEQLRKAQ